MQSFKLGADAGERLGTDEIAFLFQLLRLLVCENPEPGLFIYDLESDRAEKEDMDRMLFVDRGDEGGLVEAPHQFAFEQERLRCSAIGPHVGDLAVGPD